MNKFRNENKINVLNNDASDESFDEILADGNLPYKWVEVAGSSSSNSNGSATSENCSSIGMDSVFNGDTSADTLFPMDAANGCTIIIFKATY